MVLWTKLLTLADGMLGWNFTKAGINKAILEFGKVTELKIDRRNKTVAVSLLLNGETSPLQLKIDAYQLIKQNQQSTAIKISAASADRPWAQALLKYFVVGKEFSLPPGKADLIEGMLR